MGALSSVLIPSAVGVISYSAIKAVEEQDKPTELEAMVAKEVATPDLIQNPDLGKYTSMIMSERDTMNKAEGLCH